MQAGCTAVVGNIADRINFFLYQNPIYFVDILASIADILAVKFPGNIFSHGTEKCYNNCSARGEQEGKMRSLIFINQFIHST